MISSFGGYCKETFEKKNDEFKPSFDKEMCETYFKTFFKQCSSNKSFQVIWKN